MSCKYNNSMFTTIPKEIEEFEGFDVDEVIEEEVEYIDYSFADEEIKELAHIDYLIAKYGSSDKK